jgi:hypothetical protein
MDQPLVAAPGKTALEYALERGCSLDWVYQLCRTGRLPHTCPRCRIGNFVTCINKQTGLPISFCSRPECDLIVFSHRRQTFKCVLCRKRHDNYLLKPSVWRQAGLEITDTVCQSCVARRLDRKLRPQDFAMLPVPGRNGRLSIVFDNEFAWSLARRVQARRTAIAKTQAAKARVRP